MRACWWPSPRHPARSRAGGACRRTSSRRTKSRRGGDDPDAGAAPAGERGGGASGEGRGVGADAGPSRVWAGRAAAALRGRPDRDRGGIPGGGLVQGGIAGAGADGTPGGGRRSKQAAQPGGRPWSPERTRESQPAWRRRRAPARRGGFLARPPAPTDRGRAPQPRHLGGPAPPFRPFFRAHPGTWAPVVYALRPAPRLPATPRRFPEEALERAGRPAPVRGGAAAEDPTEVDRSRQKRGGPAPRRQGFR